MSPQVGNFIHDLVAMAQAMERVPQLESELDQIKADRDKAQSHSQALELHIIEYKATIDDLQSKVRSLEVERDDASFRTMEVEDTLHATLVQARQAQDYINSVIAKLDPPKPEPEPVQEGVLEPVVSTPYYPLSTPPFGQSEVDPIPSSSASSVSESGSLETKPEPYDPEPSVKWSVDWYSWNDRRNERSLRSSF